MIMASHSVVNGIYLEEWLFLVLLLRLYATIASFHYISRFISFGFQIAAQSTNNHDLLFIFTLYDVNILTVSHIFSKIGRRFSSPRGISRLLEALKDRNKHRNRHWSYRREILALHYINTEHIMVVHTFYRLYMLPSNIWRISEAGYDQNGKIAKLHTSPVGKDRFHDLNW